MKGWSRAPGEAAVLARRICVVALGNLHSVAGIFLLFSLPSTVFKDLSQIWPEESLYTILDNAVHVP